MADIIYNAFKFGLLKGVFDLQDAGDDIKVMLVTSAYAPNQDTHDFKDDITNEVSGSGYSAGGISIPNQTVAQDDTDNEGVFDGDDVTWAASTITARGAVIYRNTGVDATSDLIAYIDFGTDKSSDNGDFTIQWNAEGIVNLG